MPKEGKQRKEIEENTELQVVKRNDQHRRQNPEHSTGKTQ
jgi:hypothetical protein